MEKRNGNISNIRYEGYQELPLPEKKLAKVLPWIRKKLGDILFIRKVYSRVASESSVFFTCLSTTSLYYANYKARRGNKEVFFVLHGEVEFLFKKELRLADKIKGKLYRRLLSKLGKRTKVIVLSEIVKEALVKDNLVRPEQIVTIEHPLVGQVPERHPLNVDKLIFGHLGVAMSKKGSSCFFEMAARLSQAAALGRAEFHLVGRVEDGFIVEQNTPVKILSKNNKSIEELDYANFIRDVDYAVFTFDSDNYVFRVSGSLMDALFYGKPIIAFKQPYFQYLFDKGGNIGFLCEGPEEMKVLLERLINKDEELIAQYKEQAKNVHLLLERFLIKNVENQLHKQLSDN
ncbi:glycosyltransferase family protein [Chitinophaga flava]|uniref:glycosyltransferase family 4 protein n=1 Tax=Chitinophaga flava TaxID=2259036 RepID=UPI0011BEAB12|nr:glycosyltransferase family 4 protein [Chitinophaga flava]